MAGRQPYILTKRQRPPMIVSILETTVEILLRFRIELGIPIILEAVELLPSGLCPHHDSCPFRNLDLERSYLVFKEDDMDPTLHIPRPCME